MPSGGEFGALVEGLLAPFASASMALVLCDAAVPDMPVISVNEAFCELTGYAPAEVMGRNCRFLQGPEADPVKRLFAECLPSQRAKTVSQRLKSQGSALPQTPSPKETQVGPGVKPAAAAAPTSAPSPAPGLGAEEPEVG